MHANSLILAFLSVAATTAFAQQVWYEDRAGTAGNEAATWTGLQEAIDKAQGGTPPVQRGAVKICEDIARTNAGLPALWVTNGGYVTISGGWTYNGGSEPIVQSGRSTLDVDYRTYGRQRVMAITGTPNVTLDSLVITGGEAPTGPYDPDEPRGGGILAGDCNNLVITNVRITGNRTFNTYSHVLQQGRAGGLWVRRVQFNPTGFRMTDCTIDGNFEVGTPDGEGDGGGAAFENVGTDASPAIIENCTFYNNKAEYGSALWLNGGRYVIANSRIVSNRGSRVVNATNVRLVMFGSLVAHNVRESDAHSSSDPCALYHYRSGSPGNRNLVLVAANCTIVSNLHRSGTSSSVSSYNYDSAGNTDPATAPRSLRFINSIYAGERGPYVGQGTCGYGYQTYAHMHTLASTYDVTRFRTGDGDSWTNVYEALTSTDPHGYYRYNNVSKDGLEEEGEVGQNLDGPPGFVGNGSDPYALPNAGANGDADARSIDRGELWKGTDGTGTWSFVDMDADGAYDAMTDVIVKGTVPPGSHLICTVDLAGNPRVANGRIDRGAYEAPALPTILLVR